MTDSKKVNVSADMPVGESKWTPIPVLEEVSKHGRVWEDLANQYGVANPDPPWRTSLEGMCEVLGANSLSSSTAMEKRWLEGSIDRQSVVKSTPLPSLERRMEEDELSETIYQDVPFPERQLLALAHSLIKRGLMDEKDLAARMKQIQERLNAP
ncbi:MAG: hypothetical protein Q8L69_00205 [Gallionellaceae bacterium]|nr:hypothetical protein [Gallionellaceae bacterium]